MCIETDRSICINSIEHANTSSAVRVVEAPLWRVPQELLVVIRAADTHAHAHRRQAIPLRRLPKGLHYQRKS